jgi:hypothetical protein
MRKLFCLLIVLFFCLGSMTVNADIVKNTKKHTKYPQAEFKSYFDLKNPYYGKGLIVPPYYPGNSNWWNWNNPPYIVPKSKIRTQVIF